MIYEQNIQKRFLVTQQTTTSLKPNIGTLKKM